MEKSISPISEKTFSHFCVFINDVIKRSECGTIIGLSQREQSYRINQLIKDRPLKTIDLKSYLIDYPENLKLPINNKGKTFFFISNADDLLEDKRSFLTYFNNLVKKNSQLSLLFFFQRNITYPWNLKIVSSYQYLLQNIYFYPKYQKYDLKQFLFYLENKFKTNLSINIKNLILKECGSNLWLIKEAVRHYSKNKDLRDLFNHEEMTFRLKAIYSELEEKEKQVLKKAARQESNFTDEEKSTIEYLNRTNYLSPLLNKFIIQQLTEGNILSLDKDKKIILNSISVDSFFSRSERKGLRYLLTFPNKLVIRNELAKALWNEIDNYTDWALDQFIRRLRNKFVKLGLSKNILETRRNQGYIFYH